MFVAALTRWAAPLESELEPLSSALAEQPYDLRMKLSGTLPAYAYRGPDLARAQAVLGVLLGRKHGAVAVDVGQVRSADEMFVARELQLSSAGLRATHGHAHTTLAYADVLAVVHAIHTVATEATTATKESKVSLGRAALTGGLVWTASKASEVTTQHSDGEQVVYLFRRDGTEPILLRQSAIRVEGLLTAARTSVETLSRVLEALRQHAPAAHHDNRLVTHKRRVVMVSHVAQAKTTTTRHGNADETDLAAHVIALAFLKGQV